MGLLIHFVVLSLVIYIFHSNEENIWVKAIAIALLFYVSSLIITEFGITGWIIVLVLEMFVIMKSLGYSVGSALFFLLVLNIVQYVTQIGIEKYIK